LDEDQDYEQLEQVLPELARRYEKPTSERGGGPDGSARVGNRQTFIGA
jgi:hypothetical protein